MKQSISRSDSKNTTIVTPLGIYIALGETSNQYEGQELVVDAEKTGNRPRAAACLDQLHVVVKGGLHK